MRRCLLLCLLVLGLPRSLTASPVRPVEAAPPVRTTPPRAAPSRTVPVRTPPIRTPGVNFLTKRAGLIFSGTVLSVERVTPTRLAEIETVLIRFRVEQPVRGVVAGQTVSIREWGGLWSGPPRYRVGERLFLFFYPPSNLGLTSPVADLGRLAVDRYGYLQLSAMQRRLLDDNGFLARVPVRRNGIAVEDFAGTLRRTPVE